MLSASLLTELNNQTIDAGANFLIGKATSSFDENFSKDNANPMALVGSTMGLASSAAGLVGNSIASAAMIANVTTEAVTYITQELTSYIATATVALAEMRKPMAYMTQVFTQHLAEVQQRATKDAITATTKTNEERTEEQAEEAKTKKQNKLMENISKKTKEYSYVASTALNKASYGIKTISTYVSQGPEWVEKQLQTYSYIVLKEVHEFCGNTCYKFDEAKMTWAYNLGYTSAEDKAKPIVLKIFETQQNLVNKIEQLKKKAESAAKAAIAQAMMKIKGLLGG